MTTRHLTLEERVQEAEVVFLGKVVGVGATRLVGGVATRTARFEVCRAYRGLHVDMIDVVMPLQSFGDDLPRRGTSAVVLGTYARLGDEPVEQLIPLGGRSGILERTEISLDELERRLR